MLPPGVGRPKRMLVTHKAGHPRYVAVTDEMVYAAYVRYGYTLKEIAEHMGVHYGTVSRRIKRIEQNKEM